jgi:2-(3-amino-3-carboxypropyl)histidine synthase
MGKKVLRLSGYVFDLSQVVERVKALPHASSKVRLLIEGPQGFIQFLPTVAKYLKQELEREGVNVETYIRLDPAFGSCDVGFEYAGRVGAHIIIHLGHQPYPLSRAEHSTSRHVIYVPGEYEGAENLDHIIKELTSPGSIAITFSAQHSMLASRVCEALSQRGVRCSLWGPILGCYFGLLPRLASTVDRILVIAGGRFHAISLGLSLVQHSWDLVGKVEHYDPYTGRLDRVKPVVEELVKKRYGVLYKALGARRIAIVLDTKYGQLRWWLVRELTKLAERAGLSYDLLVVNRLVVQDLDNLSPREYDAYVITSCPHLVLDDLHSYHKPVLTPGEARMMLTGKLEPYRYPW